MKIKFEIETNSGKKLSLADLKKKAKDAVNVLKEDSNVQKAQEKAKGFVNTSWKTIARDSTSSSTAKARAATTIL